MKIFSDASEYALRALVWLAQHPGQTRKVREIAAGTHAAPGYLVKVLQTLVKVDILSAHRGSQGGFTLIRDPSELSVLDVVNAIDPIERINTCPLELDEHCGYLCPMHTRIDEAIAMIEASFANSTIQELLESQANSESSCSELTMNRSRNQRDAQSDLRKGPQQ